MVYAQGFLIVFCAMLIEKLLIPTTKRSQVGAAQIHADNSLARRFNEVGIEQPVGSHQKHLFQPFDLTGLACDKAAGRHKDGVVDEFGVVGCNCSQHRLHIGIGLVNGFAGNNLAPIGDKLLGKNVGQLFSIDAPIVDGSCSPHPKHIVGIFGRHSSLHLVVVCRAEVATGMGFRVGQPRCGV